MKSSELYKIAAGLNIEGGDPYMRFVKDKDENGQAKSNFLWVNLIVVLDRPLVDNVIFEEIWNDNRYPFLENRIDELNEHHFMAAFLMIIQYYIKNGNQLLGKSEGEQLGITIHLHQDPSRRGLCHLIDDYLHQLMDIPDKVKLEYITENNSETFLLEPRQTTLTLTF